MANNIYVDALDFLTKRVSDVIEDKFHLGIVSSSYPDLTVKIPGIDGVFNKDQILMMELVKSKLDENNAYKYTIGTGDRVAVRILDDGTLLVIDKVVKV